ncbi:MAG: DUF58 domain-containing protein [Dehalococcoidia bacterium]|nr:DUF58 domain-containing protein [Dehalococcoidia bacterium]
MPAEVLRTVRLIQIRADRLISDRFIGEYHSVFRGRGIEFDEVREYQPGDDERTIDWNVTARTGTPHVRKYVEEREITVIFVVDVSASTDFGTSGHSKREVMAELVALLALSAARSNDRVGLLAFSDRIERFVPPRKGTRHVLRLIRELLLLEPQGTGTDPAVALRYLNRVQKRRAIAFIISDFLSGDYEAALRIAAAHHNITALSLVDPRELELVPAGLVDLEDVESGERVLVDTSHPETGRQYRVAAIRAYEERQRLFRAMGVEEVSLRTDRPYLAPLIQHFSARARRV